MFAFKRDLEQFTSQKTRNLKRIGRIGVTPILNKYTE